MKKSELTANEQTLITHMQQINFGRIRVRIRNHEPDLQTLEIVREVKFKKDNAPNLLYLKTDYALKKEIVEFIEHIHRLNDQSIEIIVQKGIPTNMKVFYKAS
ncbi:MAG: hypothetical protein C4541_03155 [Candidatus Auribacter fodinae]|jgi:hypothetical protein|uniref:Uncharacterized protein n=1 Tax=Candidatus Auribacter fodinae TaxID=2093366 RepID=A0A3A4R476_9BACT|nr:MAG: hypothetical protein C4541_03155 [Candidatus Auribacter fodinae]